MLTRWLLAWVWSGLLAGCQPASPPAPDEVRIMALAATDHPALLQATLDYERRRALAGGVGPVFRFDAFPVHSAAKAAEAVRRQLPQIGQYRAVYVNSVNYARAAQVLLPPDLPVVFEGVADPVAGCLVDSLRRPGRNATGYMHLLPQTEPKMLEALHDGFPSLRRVLVLVSGENYATERCDGSDPRSLGLNHRCQAGLHPADDALEELIEARALTDFARRRGLSLQYLVLCNPADFARIPGLLVGGSDAGVLVPWHSLFDDHVPMLVATLGATQRPVVYPNRRFPEAGGLLSIEPILDRGVDRASLLTLMEVLGGRRADTLPVQAPRGFQMVLNVGATARQGLKPSPLLLRRADRLIP